MEAPLDNIEPILELIHARTGLLLNEPHRINSAARTLHTVLQASPVNNYAELYTLLATRDSQDSMWKDIVQGLTIGETYFYRNAAFMRALQEHVIPELLSKKRQRGDYSLRVWSAGCSTGEELYTLAMMLRDQISDIESWNLYLLGTDINETYLERARSGLYRPHSFRTETPHHVQVRWFIPDKDGYRIKPEIQAMTRFRRLNFIEDEYPSIINGIDNFDLIMCRNVTIYFKSETTIKVLEGLRQSLSDGGWLVIGHSESMLLTSHDLASRTFENAVFYQRMIQRKTAEPQKASQLARPQTSTRRIMESVEKRSSPKPSVQNGTPPKKVVEKSSAKRHTTAELCSMAKAAADHRNWDTALHYLRMAEAQNNLYPQIHYLLALIYREQGNTGEALRALRKAIYCNPTFALARYVLGDMQENRGQVQDANREWKQALNNLQGRTDEELVDGDDEMTVAILRGLLQFKLKQL